MEAMMKRNINHVDELKPGYDEYGVPELIVDDSLIPAAPDFREHFSTLQRTLDDMANKTKEYGVRIATPPITGFVKVGEGKIAGYSFAENSGVVSQPVTLIVHDGSDVNAPIILTVKLPYNTSDTKWLLPGALRFFDGLFLEVTGVYKGNLFLQSTAK